MALGFIPLWNAFAELGKEPDVYLLRFANVLAAATKQNRPLAAGLAARGIRYTPGEEPPAPEPFPEPLPSGTPVDGAVDSRSSRRSNLWGSSAHYWFVVTEATQATITLKIVEARDAAHADLDLYLYDAAGESVAALQRGERRGRHGTHLAAAGAGVLPGGGAQLEQRQRLAAERPHGAPGHFYAARAVLSGPRIPLPPSREGVR